MIVEMNTLEPAVNEINDDELAALERWLVREVAQRLFEPIVREQETGDSDLLKLLLRFPLFRNHQDVKAALMRVIAILPRVDASVRARGRGNKGLKVIFAPLLSAPILSAARASRSGSRSQNNKATECAANLLSELRLEENGILRFLEELKSAHHICELRPSAQAWFQVVREELLQFLFRTSTTPTLVAQLKRKLNTIPRKTIMMMLKTHTTGSAMSTSIRLLFVRSPLAGSMSVLQKIVWDTLGQDRIITELIELEKEIPPHRIKILARFAAEEDLDQFACTPETEVMARRKVSVSSYLMLDTNGDDRFGNDLEAIRALRFVDLTRRRQANQDLVELLEDEGVVDALCQLALRVHSLIASSVFAKGSGLVKLAEDVFHMFDIVLGMKDGDDSVSPQNDSRTCGKHQFPRIVDRVLNRALSLVHNILVSDADFILHDTFIWYFDFYRNAASHNLPTKTLLERLQSNQDSHFPRILAEARQVLERERYNQTSARQERKPRPRLPFVERNLLPGFTEALREHLFRPPGQFMEPPNRVIPVSSRPLLASSRGRHIRDIEILFNHSESATRGQLSQRKYVFSGRLWSASLWLRYTSNIFGEADEPSPIVQIILSSNETDQPVNHSGDATVAREWVVVPKNLNKGAMFKSKLFLWFRRARDPQEFNLGITGVEILPPGTDERKKEALRKCGYRRDHIVDTGVMQQSQVWIAGGVQAE